MYLCDAVSIICISSGLISKGCKRVLLPTAPDLTLSVLLIILYRSTGCRCRCGAPAVNLSHNNTAFYVRTTHLQHDSETRESDCRKDDV